MANEQRFPATLACKHRGVLTVFMSRVPVGGGSVVMTPDEYAMLADMAGAINYWATQPGACGSGPTPPPPGTECADDALQSTLAWGDYTRLESRKIGPFGANDWCISFVVPEGTTYPAVGYASAAEFDGQPWMRDMTLSRSPCDFRPVDPTGNNGPIAANLGGKQVTIYFSGPGGPPDQPTLAPGTYYFNIRNQNPEPDGNYPADFSIIWPH